MTFGPGYLTQRQKRNWSVKSWMLGKDQLARLPALTSQEGWGSSVTPIPSEKLRDTGGCTEETS